MVNRHTQIYIYIYIYIYTHTHTHIYIYIFLYIHWLDLFSVGWMILEVFNPRQLHGLCTFNICLAYNKCCANQSSWNDIMNSNALFLNDFSF